jgi:hypothetical protein
MSIFSTILSKIFPSSHPAVVQSTSTPTPAGTAPAGTAGSSQPSPAGSTQNMPLVDVQAVLNELAQKHAEKLNWRTSIVDLMKLVGMDSSLAARKALAQELNYTGDTGDSASMNIWLHKQVMKKIGENGGKLPDDLKN